MANTGVKFGTTVVAGAETVWVWTNPNNFTADDSNYALRPAAADSFKNFYVIQLVIGGNATGNNYASGSVNTVDQYYSFGGSTDKWGLTPTDTQINASDFGVFVRMFDNLDYSESLKLTGFKMGVPAGATIDGIFVEVKGKYVSSRVGIVTYLNCARITVYYTGGGGGVSVNIFDARIFNSNILDGTIIR